MPAPLKPADLMEACLERIANREPTIHAFAFHDASAVRATVPRPGPLRGIPIGVKDVLGYGRYARAVRLPHLVRMAAEG